MEGKEASDDSPGQRQSHEWVYFRLGRSCWLCGLTQVKGEFVDDLDCKASGFYVRLARPAWGGTGDAA